MSSADNEGRGRMSAGKNGAAVSASGASGEISPLLGDAGQHIGYVKVLRDRTEGYVATQALAIAEARLRQGRRPAGSDCSPSPLRSMAAQQLLAKECVFAAAVEKSIEGALI
jgi:hypothetical protein